MASRDVRQRLVRGSRWMIVLFLLIGALVLVFSHTWGNFSQSRRQQAKTDLRTVLPVAEKWRVDHGASECPTLERLVNEKEISAGTKLTDPWDRRYEIWCEGEQLRVASAGPDGRFGTRDDIVVFDSTD